MKDYLLKYNFKRRLDYLKRNNNRYKVYKDKKPYINRIQRLKNKI